METPRLRASGRRAQFVQQLKSATELIPKQAPKHKPFFGTHRRALLFAATALASSYGSSALAQSYTLTPPPVHAEFDSNQVDLISGAYSATLASLTIGDPRNGGINYTRSLYQNYFYENTSGFITTNGTTVYVSIGSSSESFSKSGSSYVAQQGSGSKLTSTSSGYYTYTKSDGTIVQFYPILTSNTPTYYFGTSLTSATSYMGSLTTPNKIVYTYNYGDISVLETSQNRNIDFFVLISVQSSAGYYMNFAWRAPSMVIVPQAFYGAIANITTSNTISGKSGPYLNISYPYSAPNYSTYTDSLGNVTKYNATSSGITIQSPTASSPDTTVTMDANNHVTSVVNKGITTTYSFSDVGTTRSVTVTRAGSPARTLTVNLSVGEITGDTDPAGNHTAYAYNTLGQLTTKTMPEGNSVNYSYDARGNVTQIVAKPKPGSTLGNVTVSSGFDSTCANAVKCNQPNWTKDAA